MIPRRRLHIPHIPAIAPQMPAIDSVSDSLGIADGAARGVDEPGALLDVLYRFVVDEVARAFVEGRVYCYYVALGEEFLYM